MRLLIRLSNVFQKNKEKEDIAAMMEAPYTEEIMDEEFEMMEYYEK